jgi:hypothetical protein
MALAREQLKTQEPNYQPLPSTAPGLQSPQGPLMKPEMKDSPQKATPPLPPAERTVRSTGNEVRLSNHEQDSTGELPAPRSEIVATQNIANYPALPPDWPDPSGFAPPLPQATRPSAMLSREPVMRHTRTYSGNDTRVTTALENYYFFRDDARFGGWQSYLQRSDDYVRFCCHMHIAELLTARGGAGESRVVWRWPIDR